MHLFYRFALNDVCMCVWACVYVGSIHLISSGKRLFFNPLSQILLKCILYIQHIKTSKSAKFQVLTLSRSWVIVIYRLSTFAITNYWMLSKRSYLFNKLTKSFEILYLAYDEDAESKNYIILFLFLFFWPILKNIYFWHIMQYLEKPNSENPKNFRDPSIDHKLTL